MILDLFIEVLCNLHLFQEVLQSVEEVKTEPERFRNKS
jgi:hypothetical protein